jgi:hypothetical protein
MTESTKSGSTDKKIPTEKEALKLEKQKVKVLKSALKEEKKAKDIVE